MGFSNDREESFRLFQGKLLDEYEAMTEEFSLITIDATQPIAVQQQQCAGMWNPYSRTPWRCAARVFRRRWAKQV